MGAWSSKVVEQAALCVHAGLTPENRRRRGQARAAVSEPCGPCLVPHFN
jgi:hypothetical protein